MTFLVSKPVLKPKCQSQECDIFGFDTGFETKMSFSGVHHGGWNCLKVCFHLDHVTFEFSLFMASVFGIVPDQPNDLASNILRVEAEKRGNPRESFLFLILKICISAWKPTEHC